MYPHLQPTLLCRYPLFLFNCLTVSSEPLVFAEAFSFTPHYKSAAVPFDPSPKACTAHIDHIMDLNEFLTPHQSRLAAALKKHSLSKLVNSLVLAFLLGFKLYLLLQWAKLDAFQVSVPCPMNRFPLKHPLRHQQI